MWSLLVLALMIAQTTNATSETATVRLDLVDAQDCARCSPQAYFMSLGPPDINWAVHGPRWLRVTFYVHETMVGFTVEEIEGDSGGVRHVVARYDANAQSLRPVRTRDLDLRRPGGGEGPYYESVIWESPSEFSVVSKQDTLVMRHVEGPEFVTTRRPRLQ